MSDDGCQTLHFSAIVDWACGRWLHEDCAEDHWLNQSGQDRFFLLLFGSSLLDLVLLFPKVEYGIFLFVHHVCVIMTIFVLQNLYRSVRHQELHVIMYVVLMPKKRCLLERENLLAG